MKKILAAATLLAMASGSAWAADLGPRYTKAPVYAPAFSWTGFYVGGHVGGGWSEGDATATVSGFGPFDVPGLGQDGSGVVGGGQIGYNWQFAPNWVLGIEGDISGTGIRKSNSTPVTLGGAPLGVAFTHEAERNIDWMASVRGRFGYAADRWLVYVTGGAAWADINYRTNLTGFGLFNSGNFNTTKSGWTVGGGAEYAFTNNWTARLEYLYYDFGSESVSNVSAVAPPLAYNTTFSTKVNVVRAGVNYKF